MRGYVNEEVAGENESERNIPQQTEIQETYMLSVETDEWDRWVGWVRWI